MPKYADRSNRNAKIRHAVGWLAVSGLCLAPGAGRAVTPLNTYYGPGLPIDNYFPEGVPGRQDEPGVTVRTRLRSDYNAQGVRVGAFILRPTLGGQFGYNSNVVGGSLNGQGSTLVQSSVSGSFNSDYNVNNFGLTAGINDMRYLDVHRMSHTDYNVSFGGGLNLGRDVLYLSASYQSANEEPYDIGTGATTIIQLYKPLNFTDTDFRVSYSTEVGRFTLQPNVDYQLTRFAHGDFTGLAPSQFSAFDQTRRDSNIVQGGVVARYEFQPQRDALFVINGNYNDYIRGGNQVNIGVVNSTGVTLLAGLDYQLTGATELRGLVGYQQRFFNGRTSNQGAPIGALQAIWNPTGLTTVTAAYSRTIEDATTNTVTGYTFDRLSAVVDHELFRNILLQGSVFFETANYQGSNYQQYRYGAGAGATYLVNRNIQLALSYQFTEHAGSDSGNLITSSTASGERAIGNGTGSFGQHIVLLRLRFGL